MRNAIPRPRREASSAIEPTPLLTSHLQTRTLPADMATAVPSQRSAAASGPVPWHEIHAADGKVRPLYAKLLKDLKDLRPNNLRALDDRMSATLREMGVNFDII